MIYKTFARWLQRKWEPVLEDDKDLVDAYGLVFGTVQGQAVLNDLLDNSYCTVYEGNDELECFAHNAQRKQIQYILLQIDKANHPEKYKGEVVENPAYDPRMEAAPDES